MNSLATMVEAHFGLRQQPFSLTPNTDFCLNPASHFRALRTLNVALDGVEGFINILSHKALLAAFGQGEKTVLKNTPDKPWRTRRAPGFEMLVIRDLGEDLHESA